MLRPFAALPIVNVIHTVRAHSRDCRDVMAREYLIRVERRLMAMALGDLPTIH